MQLRHAQRVFYCIMTPELSLFYIGFPRGNCILPRLVRAPDISSCIRVSSISQRLIRLYCIALRNRMPEVTSKCQHHHRSSLFHIFRQNICDKSYRVIRCVWSMVNPGSCLSADSRSRVSCPPQVLRCQLAASSISSSYVVYLALKNDKVKTSILNFME